MVPLTYRRTYYKAALIDPLIKNQVETGFDSGVSSASDVVLTTNDAAAFHIACCGHGRPRKQPVKGKHHY